MTVLTTAGRYRTEVVLLVVLGGVLALATAVTIGTMAGVLP